LKNKTIHIVAFDIPSPPTYGGIIDVFYKIKTLHEQGVKIILHVFKYKPDKTLDIEQYCKKVYYYKRKSIFLSFLSRKPYIVASRQSSILNANLNKDTCPILFEGLQTTLPLLQNDFSNRLTAVRMHNIEHEYYEQLSKNEIHPIKKKYMLIESKKLLIYESILTQVDLIFSISTQDQKYFSDKFKNKSIYLPVFHEYNNIARRQSEPYALYHGNFSVAENIVAIKFLLEVFKELNYSLVIAGNHLPQSLINTINNSPNVTYKKINSNSELKEIREKAHINVLYSNQDTGIKLKLIHSLYSGTHIITNDQMVINTNLSKICTVANTVEEYKKAIINLSQMEQPSSTVLSERKEVLSQFDVSENCNIIIDNMFR
jgi:hypothetical protein